MIYQASCSGSIFSIEEKQGLYFIEDQQFNPVFHSRDSDEITLEINGRISRIKAVSRSEDGRTLFARVNGKPVSIELKSSTDLLLEKMGLSTGGAAGSGKVKAPMPGLIVKVLVNPGEMVEKGQVLLNFEAMKMENQLKSPVSGQVKEVLIRQGDKVDKGRILVEII